MNDIELLEHIAEVLEKLEHIVREHLELTPAQIATQSADERRAYSLARARVVTAQDYIQRTTEQFK
jgi:hypothetical protein